MLISLLAQCEDGKGFFQVVIVEADSVEAAKASAGRFYAAQGAKLVEFDDEETGQVNREDVDFPFRDAPLEQVVATSGRVWFDGDG